jgi:UDP-N-acetylglucosamine 2-epimerase (non-hydrolysing)
LKIFGIEPGTDLNIMREGQSLEHIAKLVIERISPVLKKEKPDLVLVHGDTSTTFLTALACFYQRIPVGHVEAGLRSHDFDHPFPEEANRRLADALCSLHFAATITAKENLAEENIPPQKIFVTGNSVIDALEWAVLQKREFENKTLRSFFSRSHPHPNPLPSKERGINRGFRAITGPRSQIILVTAHRRENFGKPLENICSALRKVVDSRPGAQIIYPVHPNPNVQRTAQKILSKHSGILLLPPLNYIDFCKLMERCAFVVTDSGGIQEEAPSLGKPVLVLRKVTERPEAVAASTAKVIGTEAKRIFQEVSSLLTDDRLYAKMAAAVNPYGDGRAAERIVKAILFYFGFGKRPEDFSPS